MRDLGETITVGLNDQLLKRSRDQRRHWLYGPRSVIPPIPGQDSLIKPGKGTYISQTSQSVTRFPDTHH
ncbi:FapA family protein [Vibrio chagasii]|nr:FapA family protein [Vibrio chagasii]